MACICSTSGSPGSDTCPGSSLEMVHSTSMPVKEMLENHLFQSLCCDSVSVAGLPDHAIRHFKPCLLVDKALSDVSSCSGDKGDSYLAFSWDFEDRSCGNLHTTASREESI